MTSHHILSIAAEMIHFECVTKVVDVETVFLYRELEEKVYLMCPPDVKDVQDDDCIILQKCIYGLVQAARQYIRMAIELLKKLGFIRGIVDP